MGLGSYPTVSLADARLKRDQNKRLLAEGIDPIEAAKVSKAKAANASYRKFDDAAEQCIDALSAQWSNAKHRQQWTNTLKTYASPVIGQLDVAEIDTNLILNVLQPIWVEKAETASRLRQRLETVFSWCIARGLREAPNPVTWKGNLEFLFTCIQQGQKTLNITRHPPEIGRSFYTMNYVSGTRLTAYAFRFPDAHRMSHHRGDSGSVE